MAATSSLSLSIITSDLPRLNGVEVGNRRNLATSAAASDEPQPSANFTKRGIILTAVAAALSVGSLPSSRPALAEGKPEKYEVFVDKVDGYSYYYPSDWRDFDFIGHDSAFKDRYLQLQNVRLSFIPTDKHDIHDLGPIQEVVEHLLRNVFSAPTQVPTLLSMEERSIDGTSYCTFEYILTNKNFSRAAFATIAIGNGRYYTLIVGANERRWSRVRNQLKVVADSFKVLDI